ncbi:MAG: Histidine kinase [Labilithrix sp.]|nr:Histidine kinase [Labilithrix sp.]
MTRTALTKALEPHRILPIGTALGTDRRLAVLRIVVVAVSAIIFALVSDRPGYRPHFGWGVLAVAMVDAVAIVRFELYRRHGSSWAYPRAIADAVIILSWLAATGGSDSPWNMLMALTLATGSHRYGTRVAAVVAIVYFVGYIGIAAALGQLAARSLHLTVHIASLLCIGGAMGAIVHARSKRLASRLRLLSTMQQVAHVGSFEWSLETNTLTWSDELRRIFGLRDGLEPSLEFFIQSVHPDDREHVLSTVNGAVVDRRPFLLDHRILREDGTVRWIHCRGVVVQAADGLPTTVAGSSQDITDQKMLEAKLLLSDRLASIGTMASGIAHEINNPLAYIATNLEVIDRQLGRTTPTPRLREALDAARHGSDRVREIVRGLKSFARPEDECLAPVPLSRVVDFAVRMVSREIESRARLVQDVEYPGFVLAAEARLSQVFVNLLVNAAHAIERGTPEQNEIHIRIGAAPGQRAFVEIRDTGTGISKANLGRIFDPFFTTKPAGVGTGIGLAICKSILEELGGEIMVESELGVGSTFRVELPMAEEAPVPPPRPEPTVDCRALRRSRVLIVDDEERYAKSLELLLASDYEVELAKDGKRALDLFSRGERFDVILCDLMMPRMTGMEIHEDLGDAAHDQRQRMVFLTGGATSENARAFLARPDIRHLEKPLELPKLEAAISAVTA